MTVRLSTGLRNNLAGTTGFAATFANGIIEIRTGSQPVHADNASPGTLLGTVTLASGAFTPGSPTNGLTWGAASGGYVGKSGTWSFLGIADGIAGWFRLKGNAPDNNLSSVVLPRLDGSVAVSGADLNLSNISIVVGSPVTIDTFSWSQPES